MNLKFIEGGQAGYKVVKFRGVVKFREDCFSLILCLLLSGGGWRR